MRKQFLGFIGWVALLGVTTACASATDGAAPLQIRIANRSDHDFQRVRVTFPSETVEYGRVEDGEVTAYRQVKTAYRYALVEVTTDERSITFQPQDYMGEEPLAPGRFTYALRLDPSGENLQIELVAE